MELLHERCAGLDIHKQVVVACRLSPDEQGRSHKEVQSFRTLTADLLALGDWLAAAGVTHVGSCPSCA